MSRYIQELVERFPAISPLRKDIITIFEKVKSSFEKGSTLFVCGNGGSAADAEHMAGELMKSFVLPRNLSGEMTEKFTEYFGKQGMKIAEKLQNGLPVISLVSGIGFNTAFANDVSADMVFAQQLYVLAEKSDIMIAFSTSGNSANIAKAIATARVKGVYSILFTGEDGGQCAKMADYSLKIPSSETRIIQEYHLPVYHVLCLMLEEYFYG